MAYTYYDVRAQVTTNIRALDTTRSLQLLNRALNKLWNAHPLPGTTAEISEFFLDRGRQVYGSPEVEIFSDQANLISATLVRFETDGNFREESLEPMTLIRNLGSRGLPSAIAFDPRLKQYTIDTIPEPDPLRWFIKGEYKKREPEITTANETDDLFEDSYFFALVEMMEAIYRNDPRGQQQAIMSAYAALPSAYATTPIEPGAGFYFDY